MAITAINTAAAIIPSQAEKLTQLCKATADGHRLQILRVLKRESYGVLELCNILAIKQSTLSHHLKILANAQLVATRREGNSIFYRRKLVLDNEQFRSIKQSLFDQIDTLPLEQDIRRQMALIQQERSQLSLNFFKRNASKFAEKQGLITEYADYKTSLSDLIWGIDLHADASVMEVGPGEGELLIELAEHFQHLWALDNSSEMLNRAKLAAEQAGHNKINFVLGDTGVASKQQLRCDLVIFNMVLHHISSPARTFEEAAAVLKPKGHLLIVELSSHNQDWVRQSCGDLWLGFDSEELSHWARAAGLDDGKSLYLGLRNGFQIQMRLFSKP
ncbi:MAG: ArsR family transcriptional regulator [SAR86 cluster bacterium]|uniref:ArsR family transcriptional regulator n=1 Tax=SAR86 cluster bacterium TaxID=2030880 RepID=A0A2A4MTZ9_9GAMM|nr:MAG: ArsR family transcriptional regulator [SAR86 cluster bacterium]